ncbi:nitroreductase/quinone reductase family protein [Nocardia crassostreae]|uniref:nitroreductase/quinone reductase family protein n=1 Tax=Nocardia crassostreae TaxID=53428 RepID=UPI001471B95C|nr:nitroreductase/quinone reductase family protein [Nocardia crassostreae]
MSNQEFIAEFRANAGKLSGPFANIDVLLLTTTTPTADRRTVPLGYARDAARLIVFAADDGRENGPNWYHDLLVHPHAEVEVGTETHQVVASVATGEERTRIWETQLERWDFLSALQSKVTWQVPVVILENNRPGT